MTKEDRRAKYTQKAHDRRDKKNQSGRARHVVCFKCRQQGHLASDCTENNADGSSSNSNPEEPNILCYKCGSTDHNLKDCRVYRGRGDNDLPHATCFVCQEKGHLSSNCSKNTKGMYVNGGSCRSCGSKQHVYSNCPDRVKKKDTGTVEEETFDDLLVEENSAAALKK
eukprot:CAMPEP_0119028442 /NCGR_PEP_ID=MMETSP1176-20130426/38882_1 /TAXON_ID=265551 /ORGANISM="Synedropsis recta cf, Strain CCMP1620" /LENGTH=167 /DNA_ID=CAMNT_0006984571 /DNA_START=113 /DNA_END=613 /DNA_ORIENTATION=-